MICDWRLGTGDWGLRLETSIINVVALLVLAPPEGPFGFVFVRATDLARQGHSRAPGG